LTCLDSHPFWNLGFLFRYQAGDFQRHATKRHGHETS
jgi:hypothetical protein